MVDLDVPDVVTGWFGFGPEENQKHDGQCDYRRSGNHWAFPRRARHRLLRSRLQLPSLRAQIHHRVFDALVALRRVFGQALGDDALELWQGVLLIREVQARSRPIDNGAQRFRSTGTPKGNRAGQHLMKHDPETEDVAPVIDFLSPGLLGRHVGDRTHDLSGIGLSPGESLDVAAFSGERLCQLGETEVDDLGMAVLGHHDIGRLHVAVEDSFFVSLCKSFRHIGGDLEGAAKGVEGLWQEPPVVARRG